MTVGVLHNPWVKRRGGPLRRYHTMLELKANPRDEHYLRELFAERYPDGRVGGSESISDADRVVLLYADAIGLGWGGVERSIRRRAPQGAELRVLNGRRRDFALDAGMRRGLQLRRIMERTLAGEAFFTLAFLALTPFLTATDRIRGRR